MWQSASDSVRARARLMPEDATSRAAYLATQSVRELRARCAQYQVRTDGLLEKEDIIRALVAAEAGTSQRGYARHPSRGRARHESDSYDYDEDESDSDAEDGSDSEDERVSRSRSARSTKQSSRR